MASRFATVAEEQILAVNKAAANRPWEHLEGYKIGLERFLQVRFYYS